MMRRRHKGGGENGVRGNKPDSMFRLWPNSTGRFLLSKLTVTTPTHRAIRGDTGHSGSATVTIVSSISCVRQTGTFNTK